MIDKNDSCDRISRLIETLRKITLAVQIVPFAYTFLYGIVILGSLSGNHQIQSVCNFMFFVSPVMIVAHVIYSRILNLCRLHKLACVMPMIPQTIEFINAYTERTPRALLVILNTISLMLIAKLIISSNRTILLKNYGR